MPLVPQPLPWSSTYGREIADGSNNIVQYTVANLGLMCLAVNAHDQMVQALDAVDEYFIKNRPATENGEAVWALAKAARGRIGPAVLAASIEGAAGPDPGLDQKIAVELQVPQALYTSSTDAAMSLVPKDWQFRVSTKDHSIQENSLSPPVPVQVCLVELLGPGGRMVTGTHSQIAIALCAAAMKALD